MEVSQIISAQATAISNSDLMNSLEKRLNVEKQHKRGSFKTSAKSATFTDCFQHRGVQMMETVVAQSLLSFTFLQMHYICIFLKTLRF